jgi:hypothetical protein
LVRSAIGGDETVLRLRSALAVSIALLAVVPAPSFDERYVARVLFSLPYGDRDDEIPLHVLREVEEVSTSSLVQIFAAGDGTVWVADATRARVRRFSREGKLLRVVGRKEASVDEEGVILPPRDARRICNGWGLPLTYSIRDVSSFVGRLDGTCYVCSMSPNAVLVFDPEGRLVEPSYDSYGYVVRRAAWQKIQSELAENPIRGAARPSVGDVAVDVEGHLYVELPAANEYGEMIAEFSPELDLLGVAPGCRVGWNGHSYARWEGGHGGPYAMRHWDADGQRQPDIPTVPPADKAAPFYSIERECWTNLDGTAVDRHGAVYIIALHDRDRPLVSGKGLWINKNVGVYRFSRTGEFLARAIFPGVPFLDFRSAKGIVDPDGNIYHLLYRAEAVDFMVEELQKD